MAPATAGHAVVFADGGPNTAYDALGAQGLLTWKDASNELQLAGSGGTAGVVSIARDYGASNFVKPSGASPADISVRRGRRRWA